MSPVVRVTTCRLQLKPNVHHLPPASTVTTSHPVRTEEDKSKHPVNTTRVSAGGMPDPMRLENEQCRWRSARKRTLFSSSP